MLMSTEICWEKEGDMISGILGVGESLTDTYSE